MSRPIKFRAWSFKENRMLIGSETVDLLLYGNKHDDQHGVIMKIDTPLSETKLMQFTGLKDKNGKEIYEGDIVKTDGKWGEVVEYKEAQYQTLLWAGDQGVKDPSRIEVIGNIYENPDLLK